GRQSWSAGDRVRVYRKRNGACGLLEETDDAAVDGGAPDDRDYHIDHYARRLRRTFASRLACAFTSADYQTVFADPDQMPLFMPDVTAIRPVLEKKLQA
ncbi:MAG TPA: hypothetical protein VKR61_24670, partial [Bryobacteraceae bacterium]|nr:hypothetical protein [Bryobacteraceae bacterium]